jgi:hypothetical protein
MLPGLCDSNEIALIAGLHVGSLVFWCCQCQRDSGNVVYNCSTPPVGFLIDLSSAATSTMNNVAASRVLFSQLDCAIVLCLMLVTAALISAQLLPYSEE